LEEAHKGLSQLLSQTEKPMPANVGPNRKLDCAVIRYIHQSRIEDNQPPYDTIRSTFDEGIKVYPGANFSTRNHIQICVINPVMIKGYFLPLPIEEYNPYLRSDFVQGQKNDMSLPDDEKQ
jgi:hypothetical protein